MRTLITGATGFVGSALCVELLKRGADVRAAVRNGATAGQVNVGDLRADTDWRSALAGCDVVVHLAARVHVMSDGERDPLAAYREVNVAATLNLAQQAVREGVKRFVFVSSVKVNGEETAGHPFSASDTPMPCDPYGQSKLEAECALRELGQSTGLEVVIVRPPLVYGPGVKANFLNLMKLVRRGVPLPFGKIYNHRSMVALDNLVDLLIVCTRHPKAINQVFMVSDGVDVGIADLLRMIAAVMKKRVVLVPVPVGLMVAVARLAGKAGMAQRLLSSLQVDISTTQTMLGWQPVITTQAGIDKTVAFFLRAGKGRT